MNIESIDLQIIMFLNYVPMFLCGSKITFIIRFQNFKEVPISREQKNL